MTRSYAVIAISVTFVTGALHVFGLFVAPNGMAYDTWLQLRPTPVSAVLVVEVPDGAQDRPAAAWGELAQDLRGLGARQIVFAFDPHAADALGPSPGLAGDDLTVGRLARQFGSSSEEWEFLTPAPPTGTTWGAVFVPPAEYGIHRRQPISITVDGEVVPSLVGLAAERAGATDVPPPGTSFLLRFPESADRVPRIELGRVLEGEVVRDLFDGRTILVGVAEGPAAVGLTTPISPDAPTTRPLDFSAIALETLLNRRTVRDLELVPASFLLLATTLAGALVYSRVGPKNWPWAMALVLAGIVLLGTAALEAGDRLLPVTEIIFSQVLVSILVWQNREGNQDRMLRGLLRQFSSEDSGRRAEAALPPDWPVLCSMTRRLLGLRRSIFLVPGKRPSRLEQAAAIGCCLADLPDDCLDPRRPPYLDAARAGEPVQVPSTFLDCASEDELIYLAPMRRNGAAAGYWAFTVAGDEATEVPDMHRALQTAADLLDDERKPAGLRYDSATKAVDALLYSRLGSMSLRARMLDSILDEVSTALVVFDQLGRVLHANGPMSPLTAAIGVPLDALTPSDLMAALCRLPEEQGSRLTRRVLLEGSGIELPALVDVEGRRYLLRFSPLRPSPRPGISEGLMCELLDVTDLVRLAQFQRSFVQHVGLQLRHEVATIHMAATLMADERLPEGKRRRSSAHLQAAVERTLERLAKVETFMEEEIETRSAVVLPVDPALALKSALATVAEAAEQKGVRLEAQRSSLAGLVIADPLELRSLLGALLRLLVGDARRETEVSVTFEEGTTVVEIFLRNNGLGLPQARLEAILRGEEEPQSTELRDLRHGVRAAERWGGRLVGEGRPGVGFQFGLTMTRFT
ncbi:CHASE2 domain-containing protein [Silicimonas algicola]|uniref:CHASE2 domain-containing protein n=1 Tax=Silicimonas algicola TaxID=1826607 RepID=A0A316G5E1_9RHOB|nr:CHASE2 domain-containing protein [Silicimonas algicola]AZQ69197.1 CHASE2 domain-containing protein [Silicimonas algicola]PWK54990.1 CHASE2 domain-containing protein [Silicimonas algicola]